MSDLILRPAVLSDAAGISAVHCSTVQIWRNPLTRRPSEYAALDLFGRWYNGGPWMSPESCAVHLNQLLLAGQAPWVAVAEGQIVGEAEYLVNREPEPFGAALHLSILYIHRDWQGRGVGRVLVDQGVELARRQGLAYLTTQPEEEAEAFYSRVGFEPWMAFREMQLEATPEAVLPPSELKAVMVNSGPPVGLALRIGRYQCSPLDWDTFWPTLALPEWQGLRRQLWQGSVLGRSVVLGLREQLRDATQADGYVWMGPAFSLSGVVAALRVLGGAAGYKAVDMLLPEADLPELRASFRMDYQTRVALWRRPV